MLFLYLFADSAFCRLCLLTVRAYLPLRASLLPFCALFPLCAYFPFLRFLSFTPSFLFVCTALPFRTLLSSVSLYSVGRYKASYFLPPCRAYRCAMRKAILPSFCFLALLWYLFAECVAVPRGRYKASCSCFLAKCGTRLCRRTSPLLLLFSRGFFLFSHRMNRRAARKGAPLDRFRFLTMCGAASRKGIQPRFFAFNIKTSKNMQFRSKC